MLVDAASAITARCGGVEVVVGVGCVVKSELAAGEPLADIEIDAMGVVGSATVVDAVAVNAKFHELDLVYRRCEYAFDEETNECRTNSNVWDEAYAEYRNLFQQMDYCSEQNLYFNFKSDLHCKMCLISNQSYIMNPSTSTKRNTSLYTKRHALTHPS